MFQESPKLEREDSQRSKEKKGNQIDQEPLHFLFCQSNYYYII